MTANRKSLLQPKGSTTTTTTTKLPMLAAQSSVITPLSMRSTEKRSQVQHYKAKIYSKAES